MEQKRMRNRFKKWGAVTLSALMLLVCATPGSLSVLAGEADGSYRVTYLANDSAEDPAQGMPENALEVPGGTRYAIPAKVPVRAGYAFTAWLGDDGVAYAADGSAGIESIEADRVLTAQWVEKAAPEENGEGVAVTYVANDSEETPATGVPAASTVPPGESYTLPAEAPQRPGYTFAGWSDAAGVNYPADGTVDKVTGPITFTAQWTADDFLFTVRFVNGEGTDLVSPQQVRRGEAATPPAEGSFAVPAGMVFSGWDTAAARWENVQADLVVTALFAPAPPVRALQGTAGQSTLDSLFTVDGDGVITAFAYNPLDPVKNLVIPESVVRNEKTIPITGIGEGVFRSHMLETVVIPATVNSIGMGAFSGITTLTSVTFAEGSALTQIGNSVFQNCTGLTGIVLPERLTSVGSNTFSGCTGLTGIVLPERLTSIGNYTFSGCTGLTSVALPEGLITVGGNTFAGCTNLAGITLPASLTSVGNYTFDGTGLASVVFSEGSALTDLGSSTFRGCTKLGSIVLPAKLKSIGGGAFQNCSALASVTFAEGSALTTIDSSAFSGCKALTSIALPASLTSVRESAFQGCSALAGITLPANLTSIRAGAFLNCSVLASVTFAEGSALAAIDANAFNGCKALASIALPAGVTSVGTGAFSGCTALSAIELPAGLATIGANVFYNTKITELGIPANVTTMHEEAMAGTLATIKIRLPSFEVNAIPGAPWGAKTPYIYWKEHGNDCLYISSEGVVVGIKPPQHDGCQNEAMHGTNISLYIPKTVDGIAVTALGPGVFKGNQNIKSVGFAADCALTEIPANAFENAGITTVTSWPDSLQTIAACAFLTAGALKTIPAFPAGLKTVGDSAFSGGLETVALNDGLEFIGKEAFRGAKITELTVPATVTFIGESAFAANASLAKVTIEGANPALVIDPGAFPLNGLQEIYLRGQEENAVAGWPWGAKYATVYWKNKTVSPCYFVTEDGNWLFDRVEGKLLEYRGAKGPAVELTVPYTIPYKGETYTVASTKFYLLAETTFKSVTLSEGHTATGDFLLYGAACETLVLPSTLRTVGFYAFQRARIQNTVSIPNGMTSIAFYAFYGATLAGGISLPESVTTIETSAFSNCAGISGIVLPPNLRTIENAAFDGAGLTTLALPLGIQSIGNRAFANCSLSGQVRIPGTVNTLGVGAFTGNSNITSIYIDQFYSACPAGVKNNRPWGLASDLAVFYKGTLPTGLAHRVLADPALDVTPLVPVEFSTHLELDGQNKPETSLRGVWICEGALSAYPANPADAVQVFNDDILGTKPHTLALNLALLPGTYTLFVSTPMMTRDQGATPDPTYYVSYTFTVLPKTLPALQVNATGFAVRPGDLAGMTEQKVLEKSFAAAESLVTGQPATLAIPAADVEKIRQLDEENSSVTVKVTATSEETYAYTGTTYFAFGAVPPYTLYGEADITVTLELGYTVGFDAGSNGSFQGTTETRISHTGLADGADMPAAPTVVPETGYCFVGWEDSRDGKIYKTAGLPAAVSGDVLYTAQYDVIACTLAYHENGGNATPMPSPNPVTGLPPGATVLSATVPAHAQENGKQVIFWGWSETEDTEIYGFGEHFAGGLYAAGGAFTIADDADLYAIWAYDANGNGVPDPLDIAGVEKDSTATAYTPGGSLTYTIAFDLPADLRMIRQVRVEDAFPAALAFDSLVRVAIGGNAMTGIAADESRLNDGKVSVALTGEDLKGHEGETVVVTLRFNVSSRAAEPIANAANLYTTPVGGTEPAAPGPTDEKVINPAAYTVAYQANFPSGAGATQGSAPSGGAYPEGVPVTVKANTGNLAKTGWAFLGWTRTSGAAMPDFAVEGAKVAPATFKMGPSPVTLYGVWKQVPAIPAVAKNAAAATYIPGGSMEYRITFALPADLSAIQQIRVEERFPGSMTFGGLVSASVGGGSIAPAVKKEDGKASFTFAAANLAGKEGKNVELVVKFDIGAGAGGSIVNTVHVYTTPMNGFERDVPDATGEATILPKAGTLSFDANGGTNPPAALTFQIGAAVTVPGQGNMRHPAGHVFYGWRTVDGTFYSPNAAGKFGGDTTLYAQWISPIATYYQLAFSLNGAPGAIPPGQSLQAGQRASDPGKPSWSGHAFLGWFTAATGGAQWNFATSAMPAGNMVLYAQWAAASPAGSASVGSSAPTLPAAAAETPLPSGAGGAAADESAAPRAPGAIVVSAVSEADVDTGSIGPGAVPLIGAARAFWSLLNLICAVAAVCVSLVLFVGMVAGARRAPDEARAKKTSGMVLRILTVLAGVLTAVMFLALERLSLPIAFVNQWSLVIVPLFLVQIMALMVFHLFRRKGADKGAADETT